MKLEWNIPKHVHQMYDSVELKRIAAGKKRQDVSVSLNLEGNWNFANHKKTKRVEISTWR